MAISSRVNSLHIVRFYEELIPIHVLGDLLDLVFGNVPLYGIYRPHIKSAICVDWNNSSHSLSHVVVFADLNQTIPLDSK